MPSTIKKISLNVADDNALRMTSRKMYGVTIRLAQNKLHPKVCGLPSGPLFSNFFEGISTNKNIDMGCYEFLDEVYKKSGCDIKKIITDCKGDVIREKDFTYKNGIKVMRLLIDLKRISS